MKVRVAKIPIAPAGAVVSVGRVGGASRGQVGQVPGAGSKWDSHAAAIEVLSESINQIRSDWRFAPIGSSPLQGPRACRQFQRRGLKLHRARFSTNNTPLFADGI
jgi:hypothetical protein